MLRLEAARRSRRARWRWPRRCWRWRITVLVGVDPVRCCSARTRCAACRCSSSSRSRARYALGELAVKATPLLLIALGLAVCFRSNVWNIGAEGQFVVGAICAGGVAHAGRRRTRGAGSCCRSCSPASSAAWSGPRIVALLRDRFNANEILVSLMLVYVAEHAARATWSTGRGRTRRATTSRRPITFAAATQIPRLIEGSRVNIGLLVALLAVGACLGVPVPHLRRLPAAGRRPGAGGGALRRLLVAHARCGRRC